MDIWKLTKVANVDGSGDLPRGTVIDPDTKNFAALKRMGFVELVKSMKTDEIVTIVTRDGITEPDPVEPDTSAPPAPETPAQSDLGGHDLSLLDNSIADLTELISVVDDAEHLAALLLAEQKGNTRVGAVSALESRMSELNDG